MQLSVKGSPVYAHTGGQDFDATKPAIVFVHGAGMDHTVWGLQARYFAHHGFAVLAPDLPAHGRSAGAALASVGAMAGWIAALMDAAKLGTAALAGHSMGALACLEAAARLGPRTTRLILCGAAPRMAVHPELIAAAEKDPPLARDLIVDWAFGGRGRIGGNIAAGLWLKAAAQRLIDRAGGAVLAGDFKACDAYADGEAAARTVACPALLILGRDDRMTPPSAGREFARLMKDAATAELADCGHMMMLEQPDATLEQMKTFLGTT
ncbi:MAG: alpha/beta hydrolase [Alphaproteobacteria bacterium]|nr:alpha/beta hydrolase [Alphaproteobacteria bacterium]